MPDTPRTLPNAKANPANKTALIYTRVSTRGQEEDGTSLDSQEAACRAYAAQHGYSVASVTREVYSGAELWDRPLLSRDRADLAAGRYGALICYATDRLSRNPVHLLLLAEECDHAGVKLEFVSEPLESTPEGQLITHVRGYAAQVEREKIRERSLRGKRQRALTGRIHNTSTDLYGYRRDRERGVRVVYEPEALIVRRLYDWVTEEHLGFRLLARRLNASGTPSPSAGKRQYQHGRTPGWNITAIRHILHNPAYKGDTIAWRGAWPRPRLAKPESDWIHLPDHVTPPIVSPEQWQSAQDLITARAARIQSRNVARFFLLRGMIWCGRCARRFEAITTTSNWREQRYHYQTYRCASRGADAWCGAKQTWGSQVEPWVWQRVRDLIVNPAGALALAQVAPREGDANGSGSARGVPGAVTTLRQERETLAADIERLSKRQEALLTRFASGALGGAADADDAPLDLIERQVRAMEREKRQRQAALAELDERLTARAAAQTEAVAILERLAALAPLVDELTPQQRRDILESLSARVTVLGAREWQLDLWYPIESGGEWAMGVAYTS